MNNDNLCDSCLNEFAWCVSGKIVFGIDIDPASAFTKDADRVVECENYLANLPKFWKELPPPPPIRKIKNGRVVSQKEIEEWDKARKEAQDE